MLHILHIYKKAQDGVAATEFALIAPILILILMGIIDYGLYINQQMRLENVARASVEYVMKGGEIDDVETSVIAVSDNLRTEDQEAITVTTNETCECDGGVAVSCDASDTCDAGTQYKRRFFEVSLSMNYSTLFPYPGLEESMTLTGDARMQLE